MLDFFDGFCELFMLFVEDGDRFYIFVCVNIVGVFGSVFNGGSYLLKLGSFIEDILCFVGGLICGVDVGSMFVLCVNGSVVSVW